jgi:hypothetical protein
MRSDLDHGPCMGLEYKPSCNISCVDNLVDEKLYVFNEIAHMDLGTIGHRFGQTTANILKYFS